MKKISSILIALTIILNVFCIPTVGATTTAEDDTYVAMALKLLEDLEIIASDEELSAPVTRGEFVGRVIKTLNLPISYDYSVSPFADISTATSNYYEICNAYTWGIISAAENFNPDREISYTEAIKIAIAACGYNFLADANGGWPAGYIAAADRVGISEGVKNAEMNVGSMFVILYNILNTELPEPQYTGDGIVHTTNSSKTVLQSYWHLEKLSGKADGAQFFGGKDNSGVGEGNFSVDGIKLRSGKFNTDKCYGFDVDVYYDSSYTAKSVYTYPLDNKIDMIELHSYDEVTFKSGIYTYCDTNDREQSVKIAGDALIVYNGKKADYDEKNMMPDYGSVKLIRNGGEYDTVIINSYVQYIVDEVIYDDFIITDLNDSKKVANLEKAETLSVCDQNGVIGEFFDISAYNVVWVAESDDKLLADVIISRDKIVGEYTGSSDDGCIYIDGGKYTKDKNIKNDIMSKTRYGDVVVAYFNANREIVYVEPQSDSESAKVGYMIQTGLMGSGFNKNIKAKMFLSAGNIEIYDFAERITINGKQYSGDADSVYGKLPKGSDNKTSMPVGLVSYRLDNQNKLSEINYADSYLASVDGSYTNLYTKKGLNKDDEDQGNSWESYFQYRASESSLYGKGVNRIFTTDETIQFIVPAASDIDDAEDSDYIVKKMNSYSGITYLTKMNHTGYSFDQDGYRSDYIVSTFEIGGGANTGSVEYSALAYLVTGMSRVVNAAGEYVDKVDLVDYQNRAKVLYSEKENFFVNAGVTEGSIIKANFTTKDVVTDILLLYKPGDKKFSNTTTASTSPYTAENDGATINQNTGMGTISSSFFLLGNVWDKDDPIYSFLTMNHDPAKYNGTQPVYSYYMPSHVTQFVCYNTKTGKTSYIKPADIRCYGGVGGSNHYAVVEMRSGMANAIFLYE